MKKAINGYLGISHANFAPNNSIMQEGIKVSEWRDRYEKSCYSHHEDSSPYAGYAYDAMWTYAYGIDKLLRENQSYIDDIHSEHTVTRFTDIISKTDFNGVRSYLIRNQVLLRHYKKNSCTSSFYCT